MSELKVRKSPEDVRNEGKAAKEARRLKAEKIAAEGEAKPEVKP